MNPYMRRLAMRLDRMEKRLVEQDQRLARTILRGKVSAVRKQEGDWQVRLEIARDQDSGDRVLSPWVPVQPASAGALKIKVKPTQGEGMTLISPSGVVGTASWAIRSPFDQDHPAPEGDEDVVLERGRSRLTIEDGKIVISTGSGRIELDGEDIRINGKAAITGDTLTHNRVPIGDKHTHKNVMPGPGLSGPPVEGATS
jgi:phage baseplate assembly protein gpV